MIIFEYGVSIRPIVIEDYEYFNKWNQDEETMMYLGGGFMPISKDLHKDWINSMIDTSGFSTSKRYIIQNTRNIPIGLIGLYSINWIHRTAEVGIYIGDSKSRGKGVASAALHQLENFAVEYCNLRKLKIYVVKDNEKAVNFWGKHEYKQVGCLSQERFIKGKYCDLIVMEKFL